MKGISSGLIGAIVSGRVKAEKYGNNGNGGGVSYIEATAEELQELSKRYGFANVPKAAIK